MSTTAIGDAYRDHIAALLATRYENVKTEVQLTGKRADIYFEAQFGPMNRVRVGAECRRWGRALNKAVVAQIIAEYQAALANDIDQVWIICDRTPAAGARDYIKGIRTSQIMTSAECEQALVDFRPMLIRLKDEFENDPIAKYYVAPTYYDVDRVARLDLHSHIKKWLATEKPRPISIWAGYGMGKTTYARHLAYLLSKECLSNLGAPIPILLNLGDYTTAPNLETLITAQLTNYYGVRYFSEATFQLLNGRQRFVLILDGFDEMKFAMATNDFAHISSQMRKAAAVNPHLLLLGRPDAIITEEEERRLTSSKMRVDTTFSVRADGAPDFDSYRMAFLTKEEYLALIRNFLTYAAGEQKSGEAIDKIIANIETLDLGNILSRPVQAKMLAEVVAEPDTDISKLSRFTLYDMFIKRILRREEEKTSRRHLSSSQRIHFMRMLAWWLWTEKKTRTFTANEIPIEIISPFRIDNVSLEGLRRELLIGSIVEEKHVGHFLAEKDAGVFYFPHTSFTEFLVADYIMSPEFTGPQVAKLPEALYGEVPMFLADHPGPEPILSMYGRIKAAQIAMTISCMNVLLNDFRTRMYIETVLPKQADPWDVVLRYFFHHSSNTAVQGHKYVETALQSENVSIEIAAMYCLLYQDDTALDLTHGSGAARLVMHVFRRIGLEDVLSAAERGSTTARSGDLNHLAEITTASIRIGPEENVLFDLARFTSTALNFIGTACAVTDVIARLPKTFSIPRNNLLSLTTSTAERAIISDILRRATTLKVIPVTNTQ